MAQPIIMPKLGQMTEESTVVRWLKKEGEAVAKGEPLLEIETDKATMEVESFYDGVLLKILVQEGETVPVMQTLAFVGEPGETVDPNQFQSWTRSPPLKPGGERCAPAGSPDAAGRPGTERRAARNRSGENQPPCSRVGTGSRHGCAGGSQGSGPGGRIIERDVLAALKEPAVLTHSPGR